jgi:hypothetical protein
MPHDYRQLHSFLGLCYYFRINIFKNGQVLARERVLAHNSLCQMPHGIRLSKYTLNHAKFNPFRKLCLC